MGVWIRSQGKGMLIYTNEIYGKWYDKIVKRKIFEDDETVKEYFVCDDKFNELGIYSSEEKTSKVLDMIKNHIQSRVNEDMIFQMPNDEEVKV